MADEKFPNLKFNTPKGTFLYAWLNKPDTKFDADGVYKVTQQLGASEIEQLPVAEIKQLHSEFVAKLRESLVGKGQGQKAKTLKVKDEYFPKEYDKKTGEETGNILINASMKASGVSKTKGPWTRRPDVYDVSGQPYDGRVFGGSIGKLKIEARPWYVASSNETGVSMKLVAAQITKLVDGSGTRPAAHHGFSDESAHEAPVERDPGSDDHVGDDDIPY